MNEEVGTRMATPKQEELMKKLGIYQQGLTSKQAWEKCNDAIAEKKQDSSDNIQREPIKMTEEKQEVYDKYKETPKVKEFHLTEEAIRSNALSSAISWAGNKTDWRIVRDFDKIVDMAREFEQYIRKG